MKVKIAPTNIGLHMSSLNTSIDTGNPASFAEIMSSSIGGYESSHGKPESLSKDAKRKHDIKERYQQKNTLQNMSKLIFLYSVSG